MMTTNKIYSKPRLEDLNILLNEYGEKLIKLCDRIENSRVKYYLTSNHYHRLCHQLSVLIQLTDK